VTGQEKAEIVAGLAKIEGRVGMLDAKLGGRIETLTARVDAHMEKTTAETRTLFASRREHAAQIAAIREDYVPKGDFEKQRGENREEHRGMERSIGGMRVNSAKIAGGISLVAFLVVVLSKVLEVWK
jgi:hypothetical protein